MSVVLMVNSNLARIWMDHRCLLTNPTIVKVNGKSNPIRINEMSIHLETVDPPISNLASLMDARNQTLYPF